MTGTTVTRSNRDIWEAMDALSALVAQPCTDSQVGLRLARTFRALRQARERIEEDRTLILNTYAAKDDDGSYVREADGQSIRLTDPAGFNKGWRELLAEEVEVTLYPVKLDALLAANGKGKKRCKECDRPLTPDISMQQLEALVHVGAIEYDTGDDEGGER